MRLARLDARAGARRRTINQFTQFVHTIARGGARDEAIIDSAATAITDIRGLVGCDWTLGAGVATAPTILPDGQIMGWARDLSDDRAQLPNGTQLRVSACDAYFGHFVLTPIAGRGVSIEERYAAAAVAQLLAYELAHRAPVS